MAASMAAFFTKPSITSQDTVHAPTPYLHSSSTCWLFLKLAASTLQGMPFFVKISCISLATCTPL